jgi:hypothetical protein
LEKIGSQLVSAVSLDGNGIILIRHLDFSLIKGYAAGAVADGVSVRNVARDPLLLPVFESNVGKT